MTAFKVVIPARYGSSRLPAKPLLDIAGKPMVAHVYQRALLSDAQQVVIATDDERIFNVAKDLGATVVMTSTEHPSGTDVCKKSRKKWVGPVTILLSMFKVMSL